MFRAILQNICLSLHSPCQDVELEIDYVSCYGLQHGKDPNGVGEEPYEESRCENGGIWIISQKRHQSNAKSSLSLLGDFCLAIDQWQKETKAL
jgi:hypothetical protein